MKELSKQSEHKFLRNKSKAIHRIIEIDSTHITTVSDIKTHSWRGTIQRFKKQFTKVITK